MKRRSFISKLGAAIAGILAVPAAARSLFEDQPVPKKVVEVEATLTNAPPKHFDGRSAVRSVLSPPVQSLDQVDQVVLDELWEFGKNWCRVKNVKLVGEPIYKLFDWGHQIGCAWHFVGTPNYQVTDQIKGQGVSGDNVLEGNEERPYG